MAWISGGDFTMGQNGENGPANGGLQNWRRFSNRSQIGFHVDGFQ
jgi:hypothetical protein